MTAKEMFEKLGYTRKVDSEKLIYAKYLNDKFLCLEITFDLMEKEIKWFDCYENYTISNALLLAICKQAKELGWIEEEKKEIKQETNLERYYDDILEEGFGNFGIMNGKIEPCLFMPCEKCEFKPGDCHKNRITWLISECKKKKHKFTQFEYDLIDTYRGSSEICKFHNCYQLRRLKAKGYFNDVDKNESIKDILANCDVGE